MELKIKMEDLNLPLSFSNWMEKDKAVVEAVNKLLPDNLVIKENSSRPFLYIRTYKKEGFTKEEFSELNTIRPDQCVQCIDGLMYWLPENGNWSIRTGADVFSTKYKQIITEAYTLVGNVVIE